MNCMNMCIMVTKRGAGNAKRVVENIHLLYKERIVAKKNLLHPEISQTPRTNANRDVPTLTSIG